MAAATKERRTPEARAEAPAPPPAGSAPTAPPTSAKPSIAARPFLLDFFPLETADQTRLSRFYDRLREGVLSTTRCTGCGAIHWPPRVACPECHSETLEWIDLPMTGRIYAFSAVLVGAPLGMEGDVPFAVGLVDLEGSSLRLFGRIDGRSWDALTIGTPVRVEPFDLADGRVFFRFCTLE